MDKKENKASHILKITFGILMVLIYIGMGILMLINFFAWDNSTIAYGLGGLFVIYGIYRGYRQFKGLDYK